MIEFPAAAPSAVGRFPSLLLALALGACTGAPDVPPSATPAAEVAGRGEVGIAPPPAAERREHTVTAPHGAARRDDYYWLRDDSRQDPAVLAFLRDENRHADAVMKPLEGLQNRLYRDIVERIKQDDSTVPAQDKDYWYYTRFETGRDYPIHARRKGRMDAPEEILLDVNNMAAGKDFYQVALRELSPDQQKLLYAEDDVGRRQYVLRVKDLTTGKVLPDRITGVTANAVWADDNRSFYYLENDPTTLLTKRVKRHVLGSDPAADVLIYEEPDDSFYLGVYRTRSERFLCIEVESTVSSETRCTSAAEPGEFRVLAERRRDFHYHADHLGERWVIRTDWQAPNYRLMQAANDAVYDRESWKSLIEHDAQVFIENVELFDSFIAVTERSEGLTRIRVLEPDGSSDPVAADEPAYAMELAANLMPKTDWLRYTYSSLATPPSTFELNVTSGERRLLKVEEVAGYDPANYVVERLWAPARDGLTRIPVSLVYRKGLAKDGSAALMQYGYGSYGISIDPVFNPSAVNLTDRGVVYAIAHVRGGQEMGRQWYEDGKLLKKVNTFTDFIDVTDHLVAQGYAARERIGAMGGSAGGLLMGAIANMAPDRYRVILSLVPFVDVVTTMLDESIPLTTNEFDEWGNPKDPIYYDYMLGYSPYDQIQAQDYPAMLITTGLWDSQVQYFEAAKYVARLRALKTDNRPLVLRTDMAAGHGGKSGRLQQYRETAEYQAFALQQLGVVE